MDSCEWLLVSTSISLKEVTSATVWASDGSTSKCHIRNVSDTPTNSWNESLPFEIWNCILEPLTLDSIGLASSLISWPKWIWPSHLLSPSETTGIYSGATTATTITFSLSHLPRPMLSLSLDEGLKDCRKNDIFHSVSPVLVWKSVT